MYQLLFFILFSTSVSACIWWEPVPFQSTVGSAEAPRSPPVVSGDSTTVENEVDLFCWCQKVHDNNNFADFQVQFYSWKFIIKQS